MYVTVHRGTQRIGGNLIEIGTDETRLLDFCEERHITVVNLHASGHASRKTLQALIDGLRPAVLLPIHCEAEDRAEFLSLHGNCLMLNDGERLEVE